MLLERFPVAAGVVAGLVIALTGMVVLSLPVYRSPIDDTLLAKPPAKHWTMRRVRTVFAKHGVPFSTTDGLYVVDVGPHGSTAGDDYAYEQRIGSIVVHYDGGDATVLARVRAAVSALR